MSNDYATLGPSKYGRRLLGLRRTASLCHNAVFTLQLQAGVKPYTTLLNFARSCVFDKQSPPPLQCCPKALSLPKVTKLICRVPSVAFTRCLSLFNQSTCVSFGTVMCHTPFQINFYRVKTNVCMTPTLRYISIRFKLRDCFYQIMFTIESMLILRVCTPIF